ncbi:MAG: hypothetical protein CMI26_11315 [Opitutae bacterium]|nr:hypothetical protein [Opitutae bacterium]|tara:strand:- start:28 stop:285 length:258 start_codon:yes stop_codon:yes gene_type:complete
MEDSKKIGKEDREPFSAEVEKIKENNWRYMGRNWGWLSLFFIALTLLLFLGFKMEKVGFLASLGFVFCIFMWVGAKDFFTKGSAD